MDIEDRLKQLQSLFSHALSLSVSAKSHYLALAGDLGVSPVDLARAKIAWQQFESRKNAIVAEMVALEELEQDPTTEPDAYRTRRTRSSSGLTWRSYLRTWAVRASPFSPIDTPVHAAQYWWLSN